MAKTLDEILKSGRTDPAAIHALQEQAKKLGLTKRTIQLDLDLMTGQMKHQASKMDAVMHLGIIEFYRAITLAAMVIPPKKVDVYNKLQTVIQEALLAAIAEAQSLEPAAPAAAGAPSA